MKILYLSSHAILEYDQAKLWTELSHDVFSIGAYSDPAHPAVDLRPAIQGMTYHPELVALCEAQRTQHATESVAYPVIDWAKADLHPDLIDWAEAVIVDCYPESWIAGNWARLRGKRVIWRTIGQSGADTEAAMGPLRRQGLEIIRYSPAERRAYERWPWWAGEDAVIRFGKDPADWYGWTGAQGVVGHLAQHDPVPHGRDQFLNWRYFARATADLPTVIAGPNSELAGGLGTLAYDEMRAYLRRIRVMLYTGTLPASYTLGLIEAMMTGTPLVSIGPLAFGLPDLFEGHEIAPSAHNDPAQAAIDLGRLLRDEGEADSLSQRCRAKAVELFGIEPIREQWAAYLGAGVLVAA